jgi:hypothetical protein
MQRAKTRVDWFLIGGVILSLWAFANTSIDILRYGWDQGFYWWFCNLALIGVAFGLLTKHRGWLTGFLSIACFTQIFWVIDNQYRIFTGKNLFGLVEFMYQPGLPVDEFILSHYHYFTIPISVLALFYLPQKKSNALKLILIFNPFIFAVSYFVFPKVQNINCIHEPCFPSLEHLGGVVYSLTFWGSIFLVHILIGFSLERFFRKVHVTAHMKKWALNGFLAVTALAVCMATWDTWYKLSLPSLKCVNDEAGREVEVACRFTLDYGPNVMLFNYSTRNFSKEEQICTTKMLINGSEAIMDQELLLKPSEKKPGSVLLPYPKEDAVVHVFAECEKASLRGTASK